jgi:hypothetical protein
MPTNHHALLAADLDALIFSLGRPDLDTAQGRLDYRELLLSQNARALIDLPQLNPDAGEFLYHLVCERLRQLLDLELLTDNQAKDIVGEVVTMYAGLRPELLPRILTKPEAAPDA